MSEPSKICPHCGANLARDDDYSDLIGVEVMGVYDGVLYWQCPRCDGTWHRWPEGDRLREAAEPYIRGSQR